MSTVTEEIKSEVKEQYKESAMSKAGRLAMEMNSERKRLRQELEELQTQVDDLSPATPTGTVDSYVKWVATVLAVAGVFMISADFKVVGQIAYALSAGCWIYVGSCWNDKAIMIGSAITGTSVCMSLVKILMVS